MRIVSWFIHLHTSTTVLSGSLWTVVNGIFGRSFPHPLGLALNGMLHSSHCASCVSQGDLSTCIPRLQCLNLCRPSLTVIFGARFFASSLGCALERYVTCYTHCTSCVSQVGLSICVPRLQCLNSCGPSLTVIFSARSTASYPLVLCARKVCYLLYPLYVVRIASWSIHLHTSTTVSEFSWTIADCYLRC